MDLKFEDAEYRNAIDFHNFTRIYDDLQRLEHMVGNLSEDEFNRDYNEVNLRYIIIAEHSRLNSSHRVWVDLDKKFMETFRPNMFDFFHLEELWLDLDNLEKASR